MPALAVIIGSLVAAAPGDELRGPQTPYDIDLPTHIAITGVAVLVTGSVQLFVRPTLPGGLTCTAAAGSDRCDPNELNALDRSVVGKKDNDLLLASDVIQGALIAGALGGTVVDAWAADSSTPGTDFVTDAVVVAEATMVATALAHMLKYAVRRPRPTQYANVGSIRTVEHQLSFPGGHSSSAAALASAYATTFWLRHPESPWRWAVAGGASAAAIATGLARTEAGFHFYTDTITGLLLGGAVGWLIPYVLRRTEARVTAAPTAGPDGARGVEVVWQF